MPTNAINDTGVKYIYDKLDAKKVDKEPGKGLSTNDYTNADKSKVGKIDETTTSISGNPISISGLKANQLAVNPIITLEPIQAGSGTPSPSNIRAISGYDKIEVLSCGRNVLPFPYETDSKSQNGVTFTVNLDGSISLSGTASADVSLLLLTARDDSLGGYKMTGGVSSNVYMRQRIVAKNGGAFIRDRQDTGSGVILDNIDEETEMYYILAYVKSGANTTGMKFYPMIQLASGASDTYSPYHKTTDISESLGQTVYGGTLDVRTGKARVTRTIVDLGDLSWTYDSSGHRFFSNSLVPLVGGSTDGSIYTNVVFSCYKKSIDASNNSAFIFANNKYLYVYDNRYTDAASFKTAIAGQTVCYELATPFEIQLTPREISLLKDYAYVSTNGTSIALDYHNGELASLADVSQLGETVNELGAKVLSFVRLSYSFGTVTNGTRYTFEVTNNYSYLNRNTVKAITIYSVKGSSGADAEGIYNQNFGIGDPNKLFINYNCKMSQSNAVMEVDILYLA